MSLSKLSKQLQRELKASPKKAGMLALLGVLALWFWAPLVFKRSASASSVAPVAAPVPVPAVASQTPPSPASPTTDSAWQQTAEAIDRDPAMQPADLTAVWTEKEWFASAEAVLAASKPEPAADPAEPEAPEPEVTPESLDILVSSTLVGSNRSAARINGKIYEAGDEIEVDGTTFVVARVTQNQVLLERKGRQFPLAVKRRTSKGRIEVRPSQKAEY